MAPEQVFTRTYGPPVDVFAFGMVLYELLTESIPYQGLSQAEIYRLLEGRNRPILPPDVRGEPIGMLIYDCWAHEPERRPTFREIFRMFGSHLVSFPGCDATGVRQMIQLIQRTDHSRGYQLITYPDLSETHEIGELFEAALYGDIGRFSALMAVTGSTDLNIRNSDRITPLHAAIMGGQCAMIQFMMQLNGIDVNAIGIRGASPLLLACGVSNTEVVKVLLESPEVDVNIRDASGNAAIHVAIQARSLDVVKCLLQRDDLDLTQKDRADLTPIELAKKLEAKEIVSVIAAKMR
jgi:ankyrin repeat protein